ncbi:MAG: DUF3395 domain-containing protein [Bryobacteraceae bacterium]
MRTLLLSVSVLAVSLSAQQLDILNARYGQGNTWSDVTQRVRSLVQNNALSIQVGSGALATDPLPGIQKTLEVRFRHQGQESNIAVRDGETLTLPLSTGFSIGSLFGGSSPATSTPVSNAPAVTTPAVTTSSSLRIVSAQWGWRDRIADVRDRVQSMVQNDRASFKVTNQALGGDPAVGKDKTLVVVYEMNGRTYQSEVKEEKTMNLPDGSARLLAAAPATPAPVAAAPASQAPGASSLRILSAVYGVGNQWIDVTSIVQSRVSGGTAEIPVTVAVLGRDPAPGVGTQLRVRYSVDGREAEAAAGDLETLRIPAVPTGPIRVLSAVYGANNSWRDVTSIVQGRVRDNQLVVPVNLDILGQDPAPGVGKRLRVRYSQDGRETEVSAADFETIRVPANAPDPPAADSSAGSVPTPYTDRPTSAASAAWLDRGPQLAPIGRPGGLRIFYARYGTDTRVADVREKMREFMRGDRLYVRVDPGTLDANPSPDERKRLVVIYEWRGRTFERMGWDGENLSLPE